MSGLEALGLACNVMAVITFALETAKVCRSIRESGSSDKNLEEKTDDIEQTLNDVHRLLQQQPAAPTESEIHLRTLAAKCMEYNEAVQKEMKYIAPKNSTRRAAIGSTLKTLKRRSHIDDLKSRLEAAKKTMDSALNVQILDECMKSKALNRATYSTLNQQHKDFLANYKQFTDIFAEFDATREAQAYETLLNSLRYENMNDRKNSIPRRHNKTLEWIFGDMELCPSSTTNSLYELSEESYEGSYQDNCEERSEESYENEATSDNDATEMESVGSENEKDTQESELQANLVEWLQEDVNSLYWVSGKPGSGKSTLMKFIENDRRTKKALNTWHPQCNIISHYLWKAGTGDQHSLRGLLCSLLHQLLANERPVTIQFLAQIPSLNHKRVMTDWDIHDLIELMFQVFGSSSCAHLVLLDGLDEIAEPHGGINKLFRLLDRVVAADRVKLCVSSRPEQSFAGRFASSPSTRMQDLTKSDIRKYTTDFLKELQLDPGNELHEKIREQISDKAEGVFIWVYVVLQSVKSGIEQFSESWDDIHDRIVILPADLMELYRDMWSRLGDNNDKYIKIAARYFQYVRTAFDRDISMLTLVADDKALKDFRPSEVPSVEEWDRKCEHTFKTLLPVSAGLLETSFRPPSPKFIERSPEIERKILKWRFTTVDFMHRTAIDFLDSSEGKELFERHRLGAEDLLERALKANITLRSTTRFSCHPLFQIWIIHGWRYKSIMGGLDRIPHDIVSIIHQCAINEARGLVRPPHSTSYQNFFLFEATFYGYYDYVHRWLEDSESYGSLASIYVLIAACGFYNGVSPSEDFFERPRQRHRWIRYQLKRYLQSDMGVSGPSVVRAASDEIMLAWRCFLLHEISLQVRIYGTDDKDRETHEQATEEILELFIKAGVMAESPGPKYLIAVDRGLRIVKNRNDQKTDHGYGCLYRHQPGFEVSGIYTEVNDAFLLQLLAEKVSASSELISVHERGAFMQPILANNVLHPFRGVCNFFHITTDEERQGASSNFIFGGELWFPTDLFPDKQPSYLQAVDLGEFRDPTDALDEIGYHLPAVNKDFDCLHTWIETYDDPEFLPHTCD